MSTHASVAAGSGASPSSKHLKRFTHAQINKKAEQRAQDVPDYRQLFLLCQVRADADGVIVDTSTKQWKALLQKCKDADEEAKKVGGKKEATAAASAAPAAVPTSSSSSQPPVTNGFTDHLTSISSTETPATVASRVDADVATPAVPALSTEPVAAAAVTSSSSLSSSSSDVTEATSTIPITSSSSSDASTIASSISTTTPTAAAAAPTTTPQTSTSTITAPVPVTATPSTSTSSSTSTTSTSSSISHSNSVERLFDKTVSILRDAMTVHTYPPRQFNQPTPPPSKDQNTSASVSSSSTPPIPEESSATDLHRTDTPDLASSPSIAIPSSAAIVPSSRGSISSSPQSASDAIPPTSGSQSRLPRSNSTSGTNAFISSIPPPNLQNGTPAVPPAGTSTAPASSPSTTSTASAKTSKFFKNLLHKVSDEMNSLASSSSSSSAAASTAAGSQPVVATDPLDIQFAPVSGPFPQPVLSPMLAAVSRTLPISIRSSSVGSNATSSAATPAANTPPDMLADGASLLRSSSPALRKKKRATEVVQIVRASAKPLPTPFQPVPSPLVELTEEEQQYELEKQLQLKLEEEELRREEQRAISASPINSRRGIKKERKPRKMLASSPSESNGLSSTAPTPENASGSTNGVAEQNGDASSSSHAVAAASAIVCASSSVPTVDANGIDLADLQDDDEQANNDVVNPASMEDEEAEGAEAAAEEDGEMEGAQADTLPSSLATLPPTLHQLLVDIDDSFTPLRDHALSSFLPFIRETLACHTIMATVRREASGVLGCEAPSSRVQVTMPEYKLVHEIITRHATISSAPTKSLRKFHPWKQANFTLTLDSFMQEWMCSFEEQLGGSVCSVPHPSSVDVAVIQSTTDRVRSLSQALTDHAPTSLHSFQQLLYIFAQLQLQRLTLHPDDVSAWSSDDMLQFLRVYASAVKMEQMTSLVNNYMMEDVLEQLNTVLPTPPAAASSSSKKAKKASKVPAHDSALTIYSQLHQHTSALASSEAVASNFTQNSDLYSVLDRAIQSYPSVAPWLVASCLNIDASLYHADRRALLLVRSQTIHRRACDLSAAPSGLTYSASFLDSDSKSYQYGPALNSQQQQYHYYFYYLRSIVSIYEVVRKDAEIILEYVRIAMCFSRKPHEQLFRREYEKMPPMPAVAAQQQVNGIIGEAAVIVPNYDSLDLVPKRDAHCDAWVHEENITMMLTQPKIYAYSMNQLGPLFAKFGFFHGLITLYLLQLQDRLDMDERITKIQQCFMLTLCCDDAPMFERCVDECILSRDTPLEQRVFLWKEILNHAYSMMIAPHEASAITPRHLNVRVLLQHLLNSIGAQVSVTLLLSDPIYIDLCDRSNLPASFYTDILEYSVLRAEQSALSQTMLESLDSYLWSERSRNLNGQMRVMYEQEITFANEQAMKERNAVAAAKSRTGSRRGSSSTNTTRSSNATDSSASSSSSSSSTDPRSLISHPLAPFLTYTGDTSADDSTSNESSSNRRHTSSNSINSIANTLQKMNEYQLTFDYHDMTEGDGKTSGLTNYYEDMSNQPHWGTRIDMNQKCASCNLPLSDTAPASSSVMNFAPSSSGAICIFRNESGLIHASCIPSSS